MEAVEMYADKSGEEIVDELYAFDDQGGREVALTPELTPTVARMFVAKQQELSKPVKWVSTRPFWRYEEPQQGRFREFYQTNVDIFGSSEPTADAEVLAVAAEALTDLGLTGDDFDFRVSHRDILGGLLDSFDAEVDTHEAIRAVDKREKVDPDEYTRLLQDAGLSHSQAMEFDDLLDTPADSLDDLVEFAGTDRVEDAVDNLTNVLDAADDFGVREYCTLSLTTARGLDYYTGVVFECFDSGSHRATRHSDCSASARASGPRRRCRRTTTCCRSATRATWPLASLATCELAATSSSQMSPVGVLAHNSTTPTLSTPRRSSSSASKTSRTTK